MYEPEGGGEEDVHMQSLTQPSQLLSHEFLYSYSKEYFVTRSESRPGGRGGEEGIHAVSYPADPAVES